MNRIIASVALACALVGASVAVGAQPGSQGGGFGGRRGGMMGQRMGFGGGLGLLRMAEVQQELKMTPAQISNVDQKMQEVRAEMQGAMQGANLREATPEERQKFMARINEIQNKAVADVLSIEQLKRFRQLEIQRQGASAVASPAVAAALKLTDEQKQRIAGIEQKARADMVALFSANRDQGGGRGGFGPEMRQKLTDMRKDVDVQLLGVLTEAQRAQLKAMQGAAFKFPEPQPRQRGGNGPGRVL